MRSIKEDKGAAQPVVADILKCLQTESADDYQQRADELNALTKTVQTEACQQRDCDRYAMLVFRIQDDQDNTFRKDDYDILLLGGKNYQPQHHAEKLSVRSPDE